MRQAKQLKIICQAGLIIVSHIHIPLLIFNFFMLCILLKKLCELKQTGVEFVILFIYRKKMLDSFHFRPSQFKDNKVCVVSIIGKSQYKTATSKASLFNPILDADIFKVNQIKTVCIISSVTCIINNFCFRT